VHEEVAAGALLLDGDERVVLDVGEDPQQRLRADVDLAGVPGVMAELRPVIGGERKGNEEEKENGSLHCEVTRSTPDR